MSNEINIRITGEAGQGIETVGMALLKILKKRGLHLFAHQDVMSRVRGGNNFLEIRISDRPVYAPRGKCDIIIALDKKGAAIHKDALTPSGVLILDRQAFKITEEYKGSIDIPMYDMAQRSGGAPIFVNSVALGVICGMLGAGFNTIEEALRAAFRKKTDEIITGNIEAARFGYEAGAKSRGKTAFGPEKAPNGKGLLLNGNEAIALGAIKAGCKFYSAYPMSPSTGIMNAVARHAKDFGIVVEQAEDEIAAINMVIGASFAGARAMTSTSGGGFVLMAEGLSLAAMTETPVVVVDCQRPAPATGFPTRTEQGDLDLILNAGHGEFAKVVYTPGTIEEAFRLTVRAFNVAEKYQIPALILSDQHLADSYRHIEGLGHEHLKGESFIISKEDSKGVKDYLRYRLTGSGVSPRAIPSWIEAVIYADSDEHTEAGHITEDAGVRMRMVEKRLYKKLAGLSKEVEPPTCVGLAEADVILVGFGSTYGVMKESCGAIAGVKAGFAHLSQVWPFPRKAVEDIFKMKKKVLTVENNAGAQLAGLIRRQTGHDPAGSILKYDGRPFTVDELIAKIRENA